MATASLLYLAHATRSTLDSVSIIVYRGSSPGAGSVTPAVVYLMNTSPQILVEPLSGMFADPVEIRVVGVEPGNLLALEATLTDRLGARYRGLGTFTADVRYPNAGHHIGQPNLPTRTMPGQYFAMGGDPQATAEASRDAWTQVLGFLAGSLRR